MKLFTLLIVLVLFSNSLFAQQGADTLHYRKVYYFGGTGLAFPLGKTNKVLSPKLFTGSMGLDISLKNPKYYLMPTLYLMSFDYDQLVDDSKYNRMIENGRSSFYMLSLAGGIRKQYNRLNTYGYAGPVVGLITEPRAHDDAAAGISVIENKYSFSPGVKIGFGSDYKFNGFFLGFEAGYLYNFNKLQGNPVSILTLMVGLKSDITRLSDKVVDVITRSSTE